MLGLKVNHVSKRGHRWYWYDISGLLFFKNPMWHLEHKNRSAHAQCNVLACKFVVPWPFLFPTMGAIDLVPYGSCWLGISATCVLNIAWAPLWAWAMEWRWGALLLGLTPPYLKMYAGPPKFNSSKLLALLLSSSWLSFHFSNCLLNHQFLKKIYRNVCLIWSVNDVTGVFLWQYFHFIMYYQHIYEIIISYWCNADWMSKKMKFPVKNYFNFNWPGQSLQIPCK